MKFILGDVEFEGFEVPAQLKGLGGIQQLAVHNQVGSGKVVQALGPKPHPVTWTGTFLTESAMRRARMVDYYRIQGDVVEFSWGDYLADVVVKEFTYEPESEFTIPYSITLEVVTDRTQPLEPTRMNPKEAEVISKLQTADSVLQNLITDTNFKGTKI